MAEKTDLTADQLKSDDPIRTLSDDRSEDEGILEQCRERLSNASCWWDRTFDLGREDVEFCYRQQWPDYALAGRQNRPTLTMNRLPEFVHQVTGGARQNKFSIQVAQLSGVNDPTPHPTNSDVTYNRGQMVEGLIRDIEYRSKAYMVYARALQHAVESGIGWMLVLTERPAEDPFSIDLTINHVRHRWTAMMDPHSMNDDFSDARWCAVSKDIPYDEFRERWPDIPPQSGPGQYRENHASYWRGSEDGVMVTDYWFKDPMTRTAIEWVKEDMEHQRLVLYEDEMKEGVAEELRNRGFQEVRRKKVDSYKVRYMRCCYDHILDGIHDWPSLHLPLVPVVGRHLNLSDDDIYIGLLRYAHDPQRMFNFWASAATERVALAPKNPYIAPASALAGHEENWKRMHEENPSVLLYNAEPEIPSPRREPAAAMPAAELQLVAQADMALQSSVGMHAAALGQPSNETSGYAIQQRANRGETGTFEFIDNLRCSIVRVGEILCDMIPRVYDEDRARRMVMPDDTQAMIHLNEKIVDPVTGMTFRYGSLDLARYAVRVSVGPHSSTQREEFVKMMIEWGRSDPEALSLVRDLVVARMDFPESREIARRLKAMVPKALLSPEDQEGMPEPEPSPEQQVAMAEQEAKRAEAQAKMKVAELNVQRSQLQLKSDEARAAFEIDKGLNRQAEALDKSREQSRESEDAGVDIDEIINKLEPAVKRLVAKSLAASGGKG